MSRLYVLGHLTIDDIAYHQVGVSWDQPGGNALYSAVGAQIWLSEVGVLARVGRDYPEEHLETLRRCGLELAISRAEAPSIHDWGLYEEGGARRFVNHLSSGSHQDMSIRAEEIGDGHRQAQAYHIAPMPTDLQLGLLRALKKADNLIALDPHADYIAGYEAQLQAMLRIVDCFLPSRDEARIAYGADRPEEAARSFAGFGPRAVAVKLGTEGSLVYERTSGRTIHVPILPVEAQDVTGAGDAYCGGFVAGMMLTGDPMEAALYGTVSASYVVESRGVFAVPRPKRQEALRRLNMLRAAVRSDQD